MISACFCKYKRTAHSTWEYGIAICSEFGSESPTRIIDDYGAFVITINDYELDWTHSLDGDAREALERSYARPVNRA